MTITIHHYYPLGSENIGDLLVAHALQTALRRHFGSATFVDFPANDRYRRSDKIVGMQGDNIERNNREADLVVVGGSNMLEPMKLSRNPKRHQGGWGVFTDVDSLRRLNVPILLVGMGTGSDWNKEIRPYTSRATAEIKLLHSKAFAAAVRDQKTVEKLEELHLKAICTGCPVTFLTDRPVTAADTSRPLIVSLPPSRILRTWKGWWFMRQTAEYLRWLRRKGIPHVVSLHQDADLKVLPNWLPADTPTFHTTRVDELIDRYEDSCGVIGFRLHAGLLALGLGKPIIPVGIDWRGQAFLETFGLQEISMQPSQWGQFAKLKRLTCQLMDGDKPLVERLDGQKRNFQDIYHKFLQQASISFKRQLPAPRTAAS